MIIKNSAQCLKCQEILESKHRHDYVKCSCGNLAVDGGKDYLRRAFVDYGLVKELSDVVDENQIWYFTFGIGQPYAGFCQPIQAKSCEEAREKMFEKYGDKWSFQYSQEEWTKMKFDTTRKFDLGIELPLI